jgi:hypothetical protein
MTEHNSPIVWGPTLYLDENPNNGKILRQEEWECEANHDQVETIQKGDFTHKMQRISMISMDSFTGKFTPINCFCPLT